MMSEMKTGTVRAITLAALLFSLALSEDSSFIALWEVPKFYIIRIYAYHTVCKARLRHTSSLNYYRL